MEQNNFISFADVKASLWQPEVLALLKPSVYNPTPERLKSRAEKYSADKNIFVYACKNSEKYIGIVVFVTENRRDFGYCRETRIPQARYRQETN